jgi:hypothetical protein
VTGVNPRVNVVIMGMKPRARKYHTKDKELRHVMRLEVFCVTERECSLSFTNTMKGVVHCVYCGRLCCPCFQATSGEELCIPCHEEDK